MAIKIFKNLIIVRTEIGSGIYLPDGNEYDEINSFKSFLTFHGISFQEGRKDNYRNDNGNMLKSQAFTLDDVNMTAYRLIKD